MSEMSAELASTENYIYLGRIEPLHVFLHVSHVERDEALVDHMCGYVYNCMIQEQMIGFGQKVLVFDMSLPDGTITPILANHALFPHLRGLDEAALRTMFSRLVHAERAAGQEGFVIIAHFNDYGEPYKFTTHNFPDASMIENIANTVDLSDTETSPICLLREVVSVKPLC